MSDEFLPSRISPANTFFQYMDRWNDSPSFSQSGLATRVYIVFLSTLFGVISTGLNIGEAVIKSPGVLLKYTIGYIPYRGERLGDRLPKGLEIDEFIKHIYNAAVFGVMTTFIAPFVGLLPFGGPRAIVWLHIKAGVVHPENTPSSFTAEPKKKIAFKLHAERKAKPYTERRPLPPTPTPGDIPLTQKQMPTPQGNPQLIPSPQDTTLLVANSHDTTLLIAKSHEAPPPPKRPISPPNAEQQGANKELLDDAVKSLTKSVFGASNEEICLRRLLHHKTKLLNPTL